MTMHPTWELLQFHRERNAVVRSIKSQQFCVGLVCGLTIGVVLLILMLITAHASYAQTFTGVRAVAFPHTGGSCFYRQILPSYSISSRYEGSIWIDGSAVVAQGSQQELSSSNVNSASPINVMAIQLMNSYRQPNIQDGLHLFFFISDGTNTVNTQYAQWVSNELLNFPEPWDHLYIASDTNNHFTDGNYAIVAFWNGIELTPNTYYTHGNQGENPPYPSFSTPWSSGGVGNTWTTGCYLNPISGVFSSFYTGGMAEDYETVLGPNDAPALPSLGRFSPVTSTWQPQELGPMCLNPRPGSAAPTKCQRAGISGQITNTFPYNLFPILSGQFSRFGSAVPLDVDDPFVTNK